MSHEVFISYSSKDSIVAQEICEELERAGVKCWIAPRDIPMGAKYASVISQAVKLCRAVVLVFSEQSAESPWVASEINIALDNRKQIFPYKIDTVKLDDYDEFYMYLNNRHWIESYPDYRSRLAELVRVVSKQSDVETKKTVSWSTAKASPMSLSNYSNSSTNTATPTQRMCVAPRSGAPYRVGDYYDDGQKRGVVFEVSSDGRHGKIVSLIESSLPLQWSSDAAEQQKFLGLIDRHNGKNNMARVKRIPGWSAKYPAFAWCANLGEGWYLPAVEELEKFVLCEEIRSVVNTTLLKIIDQQVQIVASRYYWSSTEPDYIYFGEIRPWIVGLADSAAVYSSKYNSDVVRAVAVF